MRYEETKFFVLDLIKEVKYLIYGLFIYLDMDVEVFKILCGFMVLDTVTGVIKILRLNYREFSFSKLLWGITSKWFILLVPLLVAYLIKGIGADFGAEFGVTMIVKILIVSEFISTLGNIYTIKTKEVVKDIDIFTYMFKFLREKALNLIEIYTKIKIKERNK